MRSLRPTFVSDEALNKIYESSKEDAAVCVTQPQSVVRALIEEIRYHREWEAKRAQYAWENR